MSSIQEARDVFAAMEEAWKRGQETALLMITEVKGSAYRQPGAKMMMALDGQMLGTLSGGCLESDLFAWTEKAFEQDKEISVHYDLSENELWSLGIGCKGTLDIMIVPIKPSDTFWQTTNRLIQNEKTYTLVLETPQGLRCLLDQEGNILARDEGELPQEVLQFALNGQQRRTRAEVMVTNDRRFVIDTLRPSEKLIVCGAGHDAVPVVHLATQVGFNVTVLDPRSEFNHAGRFPLAKANYVVMEPEQANPDHFLDSWWVIMNHFQERDEQALALALQSKAKFIGVLGPLSRTQEMLTNIGATLTSGPIHAPVGLDLGAETIEQVAVSIVSELMAVRNGRKAEPLHGRTKIHV